MPNLMWFGYTLAALVTLALIRHGGGKLTAGETVNVVCWSAVWPFTWCAFALYRLFKKESPNA
jgi:3-oxoacyl-[acyl-carrier-protein] synthase III